MKDEIVFVSCGQFTDQEKALGKKIHDLIDQTPYQPYFADRVTSLGALTSNIFNKLNKSVGMVAVLHRRDSVGGQIARDFRSSVWVEQEIAIASFIEHELGREVGVLLYVEKGVQLEGVRKYTQANPTLTFTVDSEIIADLEAKIKNGAFKFKPIKAEPVLSDVEFVNDFLKLKELRIELLMVCSNYEFHTVYQLYKSLMNAIHVTFGDKERRDFLSQPGIEPKQHDLTSAWVSLTRMREFLLGYLIGQFNATRLDARFKRVELPQYADAPIVVRIMTPQKEFYLIDGKTKRRIYGADLKSLGFPSEDDPRTLNLNNPQELNKYQDR